MIDDGGRLVRERMSTVDCGSIESTRRRRIVTYGLVEVCFQLGFPPFPVSRRAYLPGSQGSVARAMGRTGLVMVVRGFGEVLQWMTE